MKKSEPQHNHAQTQPAARQGGAAFDSPQGEHTAQLEAMMESSPQAEKHAQLGAMINASPAMAAQRRLADMIHNSPRQAAQAKLFESIHNSPRQMAQKKAFNAIHNSPAQTAQRKKFESLFGTAQRQEAEEPLQPKSETAQRAEAAPKPNHTGLPDNLKNGIESLSGLSMDNVKVHYNSSQPAQLNALAYAQGTDIHVAPGQEKHLPHEAWHVVQQAQGRVQPTMQMKDGVPVNDDKGLEAEADVMGAKAVQMMGQEARPDAVAFPATSQTNNLAQLRKLYSTALLDDYHSVSVADRPGKFTKVLRAVQTTKTALEALRNNLNTFLADLELAPLAGNPITLKINAITALENTLAERPTATRWQTVQDAERELLNLDSGVITTNSFNFEKVRMRTRLRKIRTDTFGTREHILTQLGDNDNWMDNAQRTAVASLQNLQREVNAMMGTLETSEDFPEWEAIPGRLVEYEQKARDATDVPFADALANDWEDVNAEAPQPRNATLYFEAHIMARHCQSSTAVGAGKFNSDDWNVIQGRIDAALQNGVLTGPHFDVTDGKPRGRFEFSYDSGAPMGTTINGNNTNRIFVVVTRSGGTVVTAYPY